MEKTENKAINLFTALAEQEDFKVEVSDVKEWYNPDTRSYEPNDTISVFLNHDLKGGNSYSWSVELGRDADDREISDQLYLFVSQFYNEGETADELKDDYDYTDEEISEIHGLFTRLYKEHLANINNH